MTNLIGDSKIYIKGNEKHFKAKLAAVELLFDGCNQTRVQAGFDTKADGPVFGSCAVISIGRKFFSYKADDKIWDDGIVATATFYIQHI